MTLVQYSVYAVDIIKHYVLYVRGELITLMCTVMYCINIIICTLYLIVYLINLDYAHS